MYPVSDKFLDAVKKSHTIAAKATVHSSAGEQLAELAITDGYVRVDKTSLNRRQFDAKLHTLSLVPNDATDLLHPLSNNEIRPCRGIEFSDGTQELVPQGVFGIEDCTIQDSGEGLTISIKGFDRSKTIQERRWTEIYNIANGTNVIEAIETLVSFKLPTVEFNSTSTSEVTPSIVYGTGHAGGDPWEAATNLAESIGCEIFFNNDGICVIRKEPDLINDPVVAEYSEGQYSTLLNVDRSLTREDVFSHVIVIGTNSGLFAPIRVDVYDEDPNSPTWIDGPFGDVPTWLQSTTILSETQALEAGRAHLLKKLGVPEKLQLITIVNPAHQAGDIITVGRSRVGLHNSRHIMDRLTIPMTYNQSLNTTCRENRGTTV